MVENAKVVQNPQCVQADTHDYFLPRPGRLSSKSGPDMIISCGDLRLVGSHRKASHCRGLGPAARWGGVPQVAPDPSPYMVLRAVWLVARLGGVLKSCTRTPTLAGWCSRCCVDGVVFQKLGRCSKKLSQNPRWDGVPEVGWCSKTLSKNPTKYTTLPRQIHYSYHVCA